MCLLGRVGATVYCENPSGVKTLAELGARAKLLRMTQIAYLPERGVIAVSGPDRVDFLQGLVSNDVALAAPGKAVWAALLSPQGKWLADFFVLTDGERLLLDCEAAQVAMLVPRLSRYRLRAQVTVADVSGAFAVHAAWGDVAPAGGLVAMDPRVAEAGWRVLAPAPLAGAVDAALWDAHRLALGLPDGSRDLEADKTVLLEAGFDELHGVSWTKGCYMGQELTARTKYRGLIKRRLVKVSVEGDLPPPGTVVTRDGVEVGILRSGRDGVGLATVRVDALGAMLACGGVRVVAEMPGWMRVTAAG